MDVEHLANQVCLFVSSSDRTADVFAQVSRSFGVWWPECPFVKFVGLNLVPTPNLEFIPVRAPAAGWREELLAQIEQLPEQYDYVLLSLDDFLLLSSVQQARLQTLLCEAISKHIDYLRLVPIRRAVVAQLIHSFRRNASSIELISPAMPYYSSLQLALWRRSHLTDTLRLPAESIWEVEHHRIPGRVHFAIRGAPPLGYVHVVEKGRWQAYAPDVFRQVRIPFRQGHRGLHPRTTLAWIAFSCMRFAVMGYMPLRVRHYLRNVSYNNVEPRCR